MVIVSKEPIKGIRPGRKDYSSNVQVSPVPVVTGYQNPAYYNHKFTNVAAGDTVSHTDEFDNIHFVFNAILSCTANVYIDLRLYTYSETAGWILASRMSDNQQVRQDITSSYPFKKIKIEAVNHGSTAVDMWYSHIGVKGIENISPYKVEEVL